VKFGKLVLVNFGGEDFAGRADYLAAAKAYFPSPAPMSATMDPGFHSITAARRLISSLASAWARGA